MKVYIVTKDTRDFYNHHDVIKGVFTTIESARKYAASSCQFDKAFYEKTKPGIVFDYTEATTFTGKEFFELVNHNDHHMAIIYSIEEHELLED